MKTVFLYELKRIFASKRACLYLIPALAVECTLLAVKNFSSGFLHVDDTVRLLSLALLILMPLLTAEALSGDYGMQRTLRSFGISKTAAYFGRALATMTVALMPFALLVAVPPLFSVMGKANILMLYSSVVIFLLFVVAVAFAQTAVSAVCDDVRFSYGVSYALSLLFYLLDTVCDLLYTVPVFRAFVGVFAPSYQLTRLSEEAFCFSGAISLVFTCIIACIVGAVLSDKRGIVNKTVFGKLFFKIGTAAVCVCLALSLLLGIFPMQTDLTKNGITKLSDKAVSEIEKIDTDTTVYLITPKDAVNERMKTLLDRVQGVNSKINVELLDPDEHYATIQQYTSEIEEAMFGAIIVSSSKRSVYIPYHEFYYYSDKAYEDLITIHYMFSQNGSKLTLPQNILIYTENDDLYIHDGYRYEEGIVEALAYCNSDEVKTVYQVGGATPSADLVRLAMRNMTEIKSISLTSKDIPSDCDALLLSLTKDISDTESDKLEAYLENGGKILATAEYGSSKYPNLNSLLSKYGLSFESALVFEDDDNYRYNENSIIVYPVLVDEALKNAVGNEAKPLLTTPMPITVSQTLPEGVTVTPLITSSETAFVKGENITTEKFDPETDVRGTRIIAAKAKDENGAEIVLITSGYFAADDYDPARNRANKAAFFHLLNGFTENTAKTPTVAPITAKCPTGNASTVSLIAFSGVCGVFALIVFASKLKRTLGA